MFEEDVKSNKYVCINKNYCPTAEYHKYESTAITKYKMFQIFTK